PEQQHQQFRGLPRPGSFGIAVPRTGLFRWLLLAAHGAIVPEPFPRTPKTTRPPSSGAEPGTSSAPEQPSHLRDRDRDLGAVPDAAGEAVRITELHRLRQGLLGDELAVRGNRLLHLLRRRNGAGNPDG